MIGWDGMGWVKWSESMESMRLVPCKTNMGAPFSPSQVSPNGHQITATLRQDDAPHLKKTIFNPVFCILPGGVLVRCEIGSIDRPLYW